MKTNYIICYDIKDEKRLNKVYKLMSGLGIHLQYSVFYNRLGWQELLELKEKLRNLIDEEEDDIRIYPLPSKPYVMVMGKGDKVPEGVEIFLK